jgi:hypothetical protein
VLGILADAPGGALHIRNPVLPLSLAELTITNLRVGAGRVSLHFGRRASQTIVNVLEVESTGEPVRVQVEIG